MTAPFDFIQRTKDDRFAEGNFTALFESMARDQMGRGTLDVREPA